MVVPQTKLKEKMNASNGRQMMFLTNKECTQLTPKVHVLSFMSLSWKAMTQKQIKDPKREGDRATSGQKQEFRNNKEQSVTATPNMQARGSQLHIGKL